MGNLNFNSAEVEPISMNYEPVEPGWYSFRISDTAIKDTKSGNGQYVTVEFELDNKRKHWENFNLWNASEKAQQIARGQFSALCRACGKIGMVKDSSELHGKKGEIKLKLVPEQNGYPARNQATEYRAIDRTAPASSAIAEDDDIPFA